jgi:hypothetical protein
VRQAATTATGSLRYFFKGFLLPRGTANARTYW